MQLRIASLSQAKVSRSSEGDSQLNRRSVRPCVSFEGLTPRETPRSNNEWRWLMLVSSRKCLVHIDIRAEHPCDNSVLFHFARIKDLKDKRSCAERLLWLCTDTPELLHLFFFSIVTLLYP